MAKGRLTQAGRVTASGARRITGISTPFGGIQWADPGPSEREYVRQFIAVLEDRRVLYNPEYLEIRDQVERSVHDIRAACTDLLGKVGEQAFAATPVRAIRTACRQFHDALNLEFKLFNAWPHGPNRDAGFFAGLGALRAVVGYQIAVLAGHYDLDIEGDLARIVPVEENEP